MSDSSPIQGHSPLQDPLIEDSGEVALYPLAVDNRVQAVASARMPTCAAWAARLLVILVAGVLASGIGYGLAQQWGPWAAGAGAVAITVLAILGRKYVITFFEDPSVVSRLVTTAVDRIGSGNAEAVLGRRIDFEAAERAGEGLADPEEPMARERVLDRLINHRGAFMSHNFMSRYTEYLGQRISNPAFQVSTNGIAAESAVLPPTPPSQIVDAWLAQHPVPRSGTLAIPMDYPGKPGHIVAVLVDFDAARVEYYDSRGQLARDSGYPETDMPGQLQHILGACFPDDPVASIVENPHRHQTDVHSCALYVADFLERRQAGESFEDISSRGKNHTQIIAHRDTVARQLNTHWNPPQADPADPTIDLRSDGKEE